MREFLIYSAMVVIVPLTIAVIRFKYLAKSIKLLGCLVLLDFLAEGIGHLCFFLGLSNQLLWPIFISVESVMIAAIYISYFNKKSITIIISTAVGCLILYVGVDWYAGKEEGLSAIPHFLEGLLILVIVIKYFHSLMIKPLKTSLEHQPMFWLSTGLMLYFSADSIIFIFSNYLLFFSEHFNNEIWMFHAVFNVILYIFYSISLCITQPKQNSNG